MPDRYNNIFWVRSDRDDDGTWIYSDYTMQWKTSRGDIVRIELFEEQYKTYNVVLSIGKRKVGVRGYMSGCQTGRSGLEGLVAAKVMIEELLTHLYPGEKLTVFGDDKRRYNIYKRYLIPLGFTEKGSGKDKHLIYEC